MPPAAALGAGALVGGLGGALGAQKSGGTNAGNLFMGQGSDQVSQQDLANMSTSAANNALNTYGQNSYQGYQNQAMNSPMLSSVLGQNGALNNTANAYNNLLQNPGLTSLDNTAYGQASGQIANQFGAQQNSIAQSLADRGMSNSGAAGAQFSNSFGNENEQLAGLQTQIAQNREQMNNQMLSTMSNTMSQLGNLGNQASGQAMGAENQQQNQLMNYLGAAQGQGNQQQAQMQQSAQPSSLASGLSGALGGIGLANSMTGKGGMFGQGGAFGSSSTPASS